MSLSLSEIKSLISNITVIDPHSKGFDDLMYRYLPLGITNENYWLKLDNQEYVLRIHSTDSDRLGLNRNNELKILDCVKPLNLAPNVIYNSPQQNISLSRWIPGNSWKKAELEKPINLNRLIQRLKLLHAQPISNLPRLEALKRLDLYRMMIQQRHGQLPVIEMRLLSKTIALLGQIEKSIPDCLCHNDLLSANIIIVEDHSSATAINGSICFLDWEYAAVNSPLFELAVLCRGNRLSEESQQYLLQGYLGDRAEQLSFEFLIWCWFYEYLSLLWGLVILPKNTPLPDNLNRRFQQLMETIPQ